MINWFLLYLIIVIIICLSLITLLIKPFTSFATTTSIITTGVAENIDAFKVVVPELLDNIALLIKSSTKPVLTLTACTTSTVQQVEEFIPVLVKDAIVPLGKVVVIAIDRSAQVMVKVAQALETTTPVVSTILCKVFSGAGSVIDNVSTQIVLVSNPVAKVLTSIVSTVTIVVDESSQVANVVVNSISTIIEPVMSLVDQLKITGELNINAFNDFNQVIGDLPPTIEGVGTSLASFLSAGFGGVAKGVDFSAKIIDTIFLPITSSLKVVKKLVHEFSNLPTTIRDGVVSGLTTLTNDIIGPMKDSIASAQRDYQAILEAYHKAEDLGQAALDVLKNAAQAVLDGLKNVGGAIVDAGKAIGGFLSHF